MPNHVHKAAAVPYVNQKGERSMKRVKVERYVAGKRPSYANDEDEEYYTTDDEEVEDSNVEDEEDSNEDSNDSDKSPKRKVELQSKVEVREEPQKEEEDSDDEDDDPRFRRLKQVESMGSTSSRLSQLQNQNQSERVKEDLTMLDEEEDEKEIRLRHALAKERVLEKPILEAVNLEQVPELLPSSLDDQEQNHLKRTEEVDLFKDLKIGLRVQQSKMKDSQKTNELIINLIDQAKEEAIFTDQIHKKIEEDNKREKEMEAIGKNGIGKNDLESVNTDDEDEELAFEEWKLREIKRVQRDQLERAKLGLYKV